MGMFLNQRYMMRLSFVISVTVKKRFLETPLVNKYGALFDTDINGHEKLQTGLESSHKVFPLVQLDIPN